MNILCEHNVGPAYLDALNDIDGVTAESCNDHLPQDAADTEVVEFAERNGYVVLTRDDDFFGLDPDCGILFLDPNRSPRPGSVRRAVERIRDAYTDYTDIREPVRGTW